MEALNPRERIMAATRTMLVDKIPYLCYWRYSTVSWAERQCRNRGMGMGWIRPPYVIKMHNVTVTETKDSSSGLIRRTYSTPIGSVYLDEKRWPGAGQWHGLRSWEGVLPTQADHMIKGPKDYKVAKYMVENTEYIADYFPIEQAIDWLGDDGVVIAMLPPSPMSTLLFDWIGTDHGGRFYMHQLDYPELVDQLYLSICQSREKLYKIAVKCPTDIVLCPDNIDGVLINPKLFERYFMPEYDKIAEVLHEHGKLLAVHMDGNLAALKELISLTPVDIIEAFHPPPLGNLPIAQARAIWKDKVIWMGFPGSVYAFGPEATRKYIINIVREVMPGDKLAVAVSTENLVSNENLLALCSVLERTTLPLTKEVVDKIDNV